MEHWQAWPLGPSLYDGSFGSSTDMTAILIAIFAALALFAASALVLLVISGRTSSTESRLAVLQSQSRAGFDTEAPGISHQMQDVLALVTRPLAPFRDWLRSNDEIGRAS